MDRDPLVFLEDILDSIRLIESYTEHHSAESFREQIQVQDAVVRRLLDAATEDQIARQMDIRVRTVRGHLAHLYLKLGIHSRFELSLCIFSAHLEHCSHGDCRRSPETAEI